MSKTKTWTTPDIHRFYWKVFSLILSRLLWSKWILCTGRKMSGFFTFTSCGFELYLYRFLIIGWSLQEVFFFFFFSFVLVFSVHSRLLCSCPRYSEFHALWKKCNEKLRSLNQSHAKTHLHTHTHTHTRCTYWCETSSAIEQSHASPIFMLCAHGSRDNITTGKWKRNEIKTYKKEMGEKWINR